MVVLPKHLKDKTIYPAYGKIVLSDLMSKEECLEACKIYPEIKWKEVEKPKLKFKKD